MNEYTLYKLITKKIVYLTDRVEENHLLLPILLEYNYLKQHLDQKMYSGLGSLTSYLNEHSDNEQIQHELKKLELL
jgi:hypothetical protein